MKLVIFDFCETLVDFQTADAFVDFIIEKEKYDKYSWVKKISNFLTKTRLLAIISKFAPKLNLSKRIKLYQIRGLSDKKIIDYSNQYHNEKLLPNIIQPVYNLFQSHIDNKDHILIISGGYSPYVEIFSEKHKINGHFATEIAFKSNKLTGFFNGKDCLFQQKVVLLENYLQSNSIDYASSVAYSDSITDLPLLKWVDEAFVISKNKTQLWAKNFGFKEIIHK